MQAQLAQVHSPLLAVRDVSVAFGGITALNGVTFDMHKGQILGPDRAQRRRYDDILQPASVGCISRTPAIS
jgi:ABC-type uncharacterized transport system ATPase subunit